MPRLAVFSDVHANFEAFKVVLADIDAHAPDELYCLGDLIGYGPQPQECCDLMRKRKNAVILQGNHEQGLINIHHLQGFNQPAKDALRKTREWISDDTYEWLVSHPKSAVAHSCRFVHGTPPDSVTDYIWKYENAMAQIFAGYREGVCFVGHTHDLMRFTFADGVASAKLPLPEGDTVLEPDSRHLVNVGAVGQPRDGDNRAKWALYDTDTKTVTLRFLPYDIKKTADLIRANGLHRAFGDRLW